MRRLLTVLVPVPIAVAAIVFFFTACTPPSWLPDYKAFAFVRGNGSVIVYDVKARKERVIVPAGTIVPPIRLAVSKDGRRIALGRLRKENKQVTLQVLVYDMKGKQKHASPKFKFAVPPNTTGGGDLGALAMWASCYWSPDGKRVLTCLPLGQLMIAYDVQKKTFRRFDKVMPAALVAAQSGVVFLQSSPVTPDGRGFLAASSVPTLGPGGMRFFGWDGKNNKSISQSKKVTEIGKSLDQKVAVLMPPRWEGNRFVLRFDRGFVYVDPKKGKATYEQDEKMTKLYRHAKKNNVRVLHEFIGGFLLQMTPEGEVQWWSPDTNKAKKIVHFKNAGGMPALSVIPAANGQIVLLYSLTQTQSLFGSRIVAVDSTGRIVGELKDRFVPKSN